MKLYLIDCKTEDRVYATNAENREEAKSKFEEERGEGLVFGVREIPVEDMVRLENNDEIIFF